MLENIEIHIVDHCNLNCASCDNFSPIANRWFITVESFKEQLEQLYKISKGNIGEIRLMGGEPLLHENLILLMRIARKIFKNSKITLLTNGVLLSKMDKEFWCTLIESNISVWLSTYVSDVDYCLDKFERFKIDLNISHQKCLTNPQAPLFHNLSLKTEGNMNHEISWQNCYLAKGRCTTLREGKIYPCECVSLIDIFNKKFKTNLEIQKEDYMDIYENTYEEICEYINKPIPFCRYCDTITRGRNYYPHSKSERKIEEWTI